MSDDHLPRITAICPTYGRAPNYIHLLQESVYWFTRQTYKGPKELLIVNDCPVQKLFCTVPGVTVVNVPIKFPTLAEKYDYMVSLAKDGIIMPWEDDDISLPGR